MTMALQFQPPNLPQQKTREAALLEPISGAIQTLPALWMQYKMHRDNQELQKMELEFKKRQMQAQYGTGAPAPLQQGQLISAPPTTAGPEEQMLGFEATPPTLAEETPEQKLERLGSEGYKALNPPIYTGIGPQGQQIMLPPGQKPFNLPQPPQQTPEKALGLTPGQIEADKRFAEDYNDYSSRGGYSDVKKNISQLKDVASALETGKSKTGLFSGIKSKLPNTKARATREKVEEVVQRNMRLVLGAQFTQKEGEALISRAFNPYQSNTENKSRLERLIKQMDEAAQAKQRAGEYFEKNGTLKGYKGTLFTSPDDFLKEDEPKAAPEVPTVGGDFQGAKVKKVTRVE